MNGTPDHTVAAWKYGQPVPCVGASWDAWTAQGFIWSLFSWLFGAVATISAGYMFRYRAQSTRTLLILTFCAISLLLTPVALHGASHHTYTRTH
jgi:hypothetical protein